MYTFWYIVILISWTIIGKVHPQKICPSQDAILPCRCLVQGKEFQIWCSHSELPKVLDGLKAVAEYIKDPIDELIIENNFLPSLPGRTFFTLKILRLMLRHNGLERVSSDWLSGLQSTLVEIFIVEPQLRSLPEDSLQHQNSLQAITIQTALLKRTPTFSGLPNLRYLQIESESLLELSPLNFKNNPKLENVHITSSSKLTRLEADVFFDLPNLLLLNISHCGISWIHPRAMNGLPLLRELWLVGNKITDARMVGRSSRNLPQLQTIKLDYNFIDKVDEDAFVDLPSLKKVHLSNNLITELNRGAFNMVPQLKTIDLNKNMLRTVHPESFLQRSSLEELYLVENDINHVVELRALLDALPRLVFLDMSFNNLETIPFDGLRGHPTLEYISLDYNKLRLIDREAFMAMPALRELRLKNNSLSDVQETPLWNLPALKGLDLSENYFKVLRRNFFENLLSLRRVDLSRNELTTIDPELFLPTPSLEHVNLSYNYITDLHPDTFRHLINLYELDVSHNHLIEFVPGLPRGVEYLHLQHNKIGGLPLGPSPDLNLPMLRMLDLSFNAMRTIPKGSLRTMPQLKRLFLGKNLLQSITENSLVGLNQLESIDLFGNDIAHIHPNAFKETTELRAINLSKNRLDILSPDLFKNTLFLQQLDISNNQLAEILPGTLDKNLELQIIDASYNILMQMPVTFYGLKNLMYLNLTGNRIKNVDPEIIGSLMKLEELKLSKNYIQGLKHGSFNNLPHLKTLHLDNNNLEYVEPNSIRDLPVLKSIKLNENGIKELPNSAFNKLPSLQLIELQDNEIRVIAPKAFNIVPQALMLNLSNNNLLDLEMAGLNGLNSLELLDVSNNRINRVAKVSLEKMEWLVELRMDNNDICGIQGSSFNAMSRLRVLTLRNNKLTSFPEEAVQRLRSNIAVLDVEGNPLICGCNILWLQAWLHESSQAGPHCVDGTPLRQIQISREECSQKDRITQMVAPGCDAEFLTAPGVYTTSQVFSQWMKLKAIKNVTKDNGNDKNNIAPSPEESEYFYDEYVDYPYNETAVDPALLINNKNMDKKDDIPVTAKVPVSTKSPNRTTGGTPTIYAASKNTTKKTNIPQKVSNSPSTSGFTFFGVPLPNLNLKNLLGRGTERKEGKVPSASVTAERKTAIVKKSEMSSGRSSGNVPSNLPFKMQPPYIQPPSLPEMQSGFLPVLPGYGGFKPIPDPRLTRRPTSSSISRNNAPTDASKLWKNMASTTDSSNKEKNIENMSENQRLYVHSNEPVRGSLLNNETKPKNHTSNLVRASEMVAETTSILSNDVPKSTTENIVGVSSDTFIDTTILPDETTLAAKQVTIGSTERINKPVESTTAVQPVLIITTEEPEIITTSNPNYVASVEVYKNSTADVFKSTFVDKKYEEYAIEKNIEMPRSTLMVSGSSEPVFKQGGRSTITKVPSPHLNDPLVRSNMHKSITPSTSQNRENQNGFDYFSNPTTSQTQSDDTNWYFANYNSTNLEPYVARITNANKSNYVIQNKVCYYLPFSIIVFKHYFSLVY